MYAGVHRALPSVSSSPSLRPSSSVRDVLWERALSGLPDQLLSALRSAELDEPGVLFEYTWMTEEEPQGTVGEKLGDHVAPSGAASSGQPTTSSLHSSTATTLTSRIASGMVVSGSVGGDPRTGHVSLNVEKGGDPSTDHFFPSGGDVKTDQFVPSGGDVKTDHFVPSGGDVKTDQFPFSAQMLGVVDEMAATCPPYRLGRLATETVSPALHTDLAFSHGHDPVHLDAFPSSQLASDHVLSDRFPCSFDPVHLDEFPSSVELPEDRDGFPSSDYLDSTLDDKKHGIYANFTYC